MVIFIIGLIAGAIIMDYLWFKKIECKSDDCVADYVKIVKTVVKKFRDKVLSK